VDTLAGMLTRLQVEIIDPVMIKGAPCGEDFAALDRMADTIAAKHREAGVL